MDEISKKSRSQEVILSRSQEFFFFKCNNFGIFKARVARFHTHIVLTIFFSFYYFLISHDLVEIGLKTVTGVSKFKFKIT